MACNLAYQAAILANAVQITSVLMGQHPQVRGLTYSNGSKWL
jgi:hypothetical protein